MKIRIMTLITTGILGVLVVSCQNPGSTSEYAGSHPAPDGFYGSFDYAGTNVVLAWKPVRGPVVAYVIEQGVFNTNSSRYDCTRFCVSTNASFFVVTNGANCGLPSMNLFTVAAKYHDGTMSALDSWFPSWHDELAQNGPPFGPPLVHDVTARIDASGTNVEITWKPAPGPATNYIVVRAAYDPTNSDGFDFSLVGTVGTNTLQFEAVGTVQSTNDLRDIYEVAALYPGDAMSAFAATCINSNLVLDLTPARDDN